MIRQTVPVQLAESNGSTHTEILDPLVDSHWDALVQAHPKATFFHSSAWAAVIKQTYGHRPLYLMVRAGEDGVASWPIFELESRFAGRRGVSLPFTDLCEPLDTPAVGIEALLPIVLDMGRSRRWRYFEFRGGQRSMPDLRPACTYFVHTLALDRNTDLLFQGCRGGVRQAVRKARQAGVRVEICRSEQAMRDYYALHCRTRRKHGVPPQPYLFFESIHRCVVERGQGIVATAWHEGRIVAAAIFFHQGGRAIYKFGASDESRQQLRANNLVMWAGIEHFALQGCQSLCFGRTSLSNEGLRRFKIGWGAGERQQHYYKYDFRADSFVQDADRAEGWHNHVFRMLPGFLARRIGAVLYRHWA